MSMMEVFEVHTCFLAFKLVIMLLFYFPIAMEYHNLNTSVATRDFWVITGKNAAVCLMQSCLFRLENKNPHTKHHWLLLKSTLQFLHLAHPSVFFSFIVQKHAVNENLRLCIFGFGLFEKSNELLLLFPPCHTDTLSVKSEVLLSWEKGHF